MKKRFAVVLFRIALATARLAARLAADDAAARAEHIRTTIQIADWPAETADALIAHGVPPSAVARMFASSLDRPQ
jgi:hypothetical protein